MTDPVEVTFDRLEQAAREYERMACELTAAIPAIGVAAVRAGLHELVGFGIYSSLPVAADLVAICLPGSPGSLPDLAAELVSMATALRSAVLAYRAADVVRWTRSELPTAETLLMLAAWNRLHTGARLADLASPFGPYDRLPGRVVDAVGDAGLEAADRLIEGRAQVDEVDPATMPPLPAAPAGGLAAMLATVDAVSDARHPSTAALLHVGDDPPRYVLCLPGLQDAAGPDAGSADLPGAIATLTGHSAYIRGMQAVLAALPAGSRVLLVGHSQGGMVAQALGRRTLLGTTTVAGVLTAGSPLLAEPVAATVPYLALQNSADPVPKLGALGALSELPPSIESRSSRTLVSFETPGRLPAGRKHNLGSGGYIAKAGSDDPRVTRFSEEMAGFRNPGMVPVRCLQVTDATKPLPR